MDDLLNKSKLITWRGMLTRLCTCAYEESEGWEMDGQLINGTLYLEDHLTAASLADKANMKPDHRLQSYFGYAFESYCTKASKTSPNRDWSGDVNTNEQWCSIVRTTLEDIPIIMGGEVDCIAPNSDLQKPATDCFIELKTNMNVETERDIMRFERYKLLKFYMQSFLLGVPRIIVGFRTKEGILTGLENFDTLNIPNLVADKPHGWNGCKALHLGYVILSHIRSTLEESASNRDAEQRLSDHAATQDDFLLSQWIWPVFRIRFVPHKGDQPAELSVVEVGPEERLDRPGTMGTVTTGWFESVIERKRRGIAN